MDDSDLLLTIAQISVDFAGFTGLASVLGHHDRDHELDSHRLQSILVTALCATAFALFPFLPSGLGASLEFTSRLSAGAFALALATLLAAERRRYRVLLRARTLRWSYLTTFNLTLYLAAIVALTLEALGFLAPMKRGIYVFGLLVLLFVSGTLFIRVFLSLLPTRR